MNKDKFILWLFGSFGILVFVISMIGLICELCK